MRQTPGLIVEDREVLHHRARSGHGAYAPAAGLILVLVMVVVAGMLGHPSGSSAAGASGATPIEPLPTATLSPAGHVKGPPPPPESARDAEIRRVTLAGVGLHAIEIPNDSRPIGLSSRGFLYERDGTVFAVDLSGAIEAVSHVRACWAMYGTAIGADRLVFVQSALPATATASGSPRCVRSAPGTWEIVAVDLATGVQSVLATGKVDSQTARPVLALDAGAYALVSVGESPDDPRTAVVEIHPLAPSADGPASPQPAARHGGLDVRGLVRSIVVPGGVGDLELAGDTVVVVGEALPSLDGSERLRVAVGGGMLQDLATACGRIAMSPDGRAMAWWELAPGAVTLHTTGQQVEVPARLTGRYNAGILATASGSPLTAAWAMDGKTNDLMLLDGDGAVTEVLGVSPQWLQIDGARLAWVERIGDATAVRVLDLSPAAFAAAPAQ